MYKNIFLILLSTLSSTSIFADYVYVPTAIRHVIPHDQSVLSLDYNVFSQKDQQDAFVITIANTAMQDKAFEINQIYKYPRHLYILTKEKEQEQWKILDQNQHLLKAMPNELELYTTDEITFSNSYFNEKNFAEFTIDRAGTNQTFNHPKSSFLFVYDPDKAQTSLIQEIYAYDDPLDQNRYCSVSKEYKYNQIKFSKFESNMEKMVSPRLKSKKC